MKITLATLPQATAQQVFDQVATHLLTQGTKSLNGGRCAYRASDGRMCAAGCLIGSDEYTSDFENPDAGNTWGCIIHRGLAPDAHGLLIRALQSVHDGDRVEIWPYSLAKTALEHNLSPAVVTNFKVQS